MAVGRLDWVERMRQRRLRQLRRTAISLAAQLVEQGDTVETLTEKLRAEMDNVNEIDWAELISAIIQLIELLITLFG